MVKTHTWSHIVFCCKLGSFGRVVHGGSNVVEQTSGKNIIFHIRDLISKSRNCLFSCCYQPSIIGHQLSADPNKNDSLSESPGGCGAVVVLRGPVPSVVILECWGTRFESHSVLRSGRAALASMGRRCGSALCCH